MRTYLCVDSRVPCLWLNSGSIIIDTEGKYYMAGKWNYSGDGE